MICKRCLEDKAENLFTKSASTGKQNRRRMCQACRNRADYEKHKRWKLAHPERYAECVRGQLTRSAARRREKWRTDSELRARNSIATAKYRMAHKEELREKSKERHRERKRQLLQLYGNSCVCCSESTFEFLAIDHVNGGGNAMRRAGLGSAMLFSKLLKEGVPNPDFQLLCHNCNMAKGFWGVCPHQTHKSVDKRGES